MQLRNRDLKFKGLNFRFKKPKKTNQKKNLKSENNDVLSYSSLSSLLSTLTPSTNTSESENISIKVESDDSFLETSFSSVTSQERSEAFFSYLRSQPNPFQVPTFNSRLERLLWLQNQRNQGVYVHCDKCDKLRYLDDVKDPLELPKEWFCYMHPDVKQNNCEYPQVKLNPYQLEELIENKYTCGSVVWAKVYGHYWAPGIVDDDPDYETFFAMYDEFSDIPDQYHVIFFGKRVKRAWCKLKYITPFIDDPYKKIEPKYMKYKYVLERQRAEAFKALKMPLFERLKYYSFISRWEKPLKEF